MREPNKLKNRIRRVKSIRKKISGTSERPRVSVFRSSKHIYAQIIDDKTHKTLVSETDIKVKGKKKPVEVAKEVGVALGKKAVAQKIENVVFDRRGYKYHGRVKALSEGLREAGLKF